MSFAGSLKDKAKKVWEDGYNHPFVQELGKGTLDKDKFKFYLLQDYLYLLEYAKVFAIAMVKAQDEEILAKLSSIANSIFVDEMQVHKEYMQEFGITKEEAENVKASLFSKAYTANMLAVAQKGDLVEILATVFPCDWTYFDYAKRLQEQYKDILENNFYKSWIEMYSGEVFEQSFEWLFDTVDKLALNKTQKEKEKIDEIFISSVEFEYMFWDMAYKKEMSYKLSN